MYKIDEKNLEVFNKYKAKAMTSFEKAYDVFSHENVSANLDCCSIIPEVKEKAMNMQKRLIEDENLLELAYTMHYISYVVDAFNELYSFPAQKDMFGDEYGIFDLIIITSGVFRLRDYFNSLGIPEETLYHSAYGIMEKLYRYHNANNIWALDSYGWHINALHGEYINIGRLQYEIMENKSKSFTIYRDKKTNKTYTFFNDDFKISSSGFLARDDEDNTIDCVFDLSDTIVKGNILESDNRYSREVVSLNLDDVDCIMKSDDYVLNIHIPMRGRLDYDECIQSLDDAKVFYKRYYPDKPFKAFVCYSWLLGPKLDLLLKPTSNIIKFRNMFVFAPASPTPNDTHFFIFGKKDITGIVGKTSLEKNIIEKENQGVYMHNGCGYILY